MVVRNKKILENLKTFTYSYPKLGKIIYEHYKHKKEIRDRKKNGETVEYNTQAGNVAMYSGIISILGLISFISSIIMLYRLTHCLNPGLLGWFWVGLGIPGISIINWFFILYLYLKKYKGKDCVFYKRKDIMKAFNQRYNEHERLVKLNNKMGDKILKRNEDKVKCKDGDNPQEQDKVQGYNKYKFENDIRVSAITDNDYIVTFKKNNDICKKDSCYNEGEKGNENCGKVDNNNIGEINKINEIIKILEDNKSDETNNNEPDNKSNNNKSDETNNTTQNNNEPNNNKSNNNKSNNTTQNNNKSNNNETNN